MKGTNEHKLKEVIDELIKTYKLEDGIAASKVVSSWEDVAGTMIFRHTEKIFIRKNKLYLKLDSPALKQELSYVKSTIIKKLNNAAGFSLLEDIVFI